MTADKFTDLAKALSDEGNHFGSALIHFAAAIYATGDDHAMAILSSFAMKVSENACKRRDDRADREAEAIQEMVSQL